MISDPAGAASAGHATTISDADSPTPGAAPAAGASATGTVFNIQRFSTSDGPGVRTTVFLKGCSNNCLWCHNPESLHRPPELRTYLDRCVGCGRCVEVCPAGAQQLSAEKGRHYDRDRCRACGACANECFTGALELCGRDMTVDEVMVEIAKDEPYYRHSGGGVTFSGGEPVLQTEFLTQLLRACRNKGLHTAVDTAGHYPWPKLEGLLDLVDLVLFDVKVLDPEVHLRVIGNDGTRIRDNLHRLGQTGQPFAVRTPVIGSVNATEAEIGGIARLIGQYPSLVYYELLPYHALGQDKLDSLGMTREGDEAFTTPDRQQMESLAAAARPYVPDLRPDYTTQSAADAT